MTGSSDGFRVKVYRLKDQDWSDTGTGLVEVSNPGGGSEDEPVVSVVDEGDRHEIIRTTVSNTKDFERQGERIIMWRDVDQDDDVALSFQDTQSCRHLWSLIIAVQSRRYGAGQNGNDEDLIDIGNGEGMWTSAIMSADATHNRANQTFRSQPFLLPEVKLENLNDIDQKLANVRGEMERVDVEELMVGAHEGAYLGLLLALFREVKDASTSQIRSYVHIMRTLILLGSPKICRAFMDVDIEILEFLSTDMSQDDVGPPQAVSFRARLDMVTSSTNLGYLTSYAKENLYNLVKMRTLRDVVRPNTDEFGKQRLDLFIQEGTLHLCGNIFSDNDTLVKLIYGAEYTERSKPSEVAAPGLVSSDDWRQRLQFLKEAMLLLANLNMDTRRELLDHFEEFGILEPWLATVKNVLSMSEEVAGASRQHVAETLCLFVSTLPNLLHQTVYEGPKPSKPEFGRISRMGKEVEEEEWRGEAVLRGTLSGISSNGSGEATLRVSDTDTDTKGGNPPPPDLSRNQTSSSINSDLTPNSDFDGEAKKHDSATAGPTLDWSGTDEVSTGARQSSGEVGQSGLDEVKSGDEDNEEAQQARLLSAWDEAAQGNGACLLWTLFYRLVTDSQVEVLDTTGDILRVLFDPDRFNSHKDKFLAALYDCFMPWLVAPFLHPHMLTSAYSKQRRGSAAILHSVQLILELLGKCVECHGYRMKYFALRHNLVGAVTKYLPTQNKLTQLAGVAFVRTVVATKDEMYLRQIVRGEQLRPLMEMLRDRTNKDDMVSSAILELIVLCCDHEIELIVHYLANSHLDCLSDPSYLNVKLFVQAVASGSAESSISGNRSPRSPRSPAISQTLSDTSCNAGTLSLHLPGTTSQEDFDLDSQEGSSSRSSGGENSPLGGANGSSTPGGTGSPLSPMVRKFNSGTNSGALLALAYGEAAHKTFPALGGSPRASGSQAAGEGYGRHHLAGFSGSSSEGVFGKDRASSEVGPSNKPPIPSMSLGVAERMSPGMHMGISAANSAMGGDSPVDDPLTEAAPWAHNSSPRSPLSPGGQGIAQLPSSSSSTSDPSNRIPPRTSPAGGVSGMRTTPSRGFSLVADITLPALQNAMGGIAEVDNKGNSNGKRGGAVSFDIMNKRPKLRSTFGEDGEDFEET